MTFGVVLLLTVVWYADGAPEASVLAVPSLEICGDMAKSFVMAEEYHNAEEAPTVRDRYSVSCELKNGNPVDEIKFQSPLDTVPGAR